MRQGDRVTFTIERLNSKGDGVAVVDGRQVVVRQTVPGDRLEATLTRKRKGQFEAHVESILESGLDRVEAVCSHFGHCGGCRWQDIDYADQLKLKEHMVGQSLSQHGLIPRVLRHAIASPSSLFYRNKMEFSFGPGSDVEGIEIGLHVRNRYNRIFDLQACYLQSEVSNRIVASVRRHAVAGGLSAYDLKAHVGLLRFLVIRESKTEGEVMVNLVVSEYPHPGVAAVIEGVLGDVPEIATFVVTLHTGRAQVAAGEAEFVVAGKGFIVERWGDLSFRISPQSFFQTNTEQAESLYQLVVKMAGDVAGAQVLDLYCGAGGISLHLAGRAATVVGVEQSNEAVEDARQNARLNFIGNCTFISGKAEDVLGDLIEQEMRFDLVVVDPPRAGVHKKALTALAALKAPQMVYVSCNAESMAADISQLKAVGYEVDVVQPIDMFPHTPHCEVVARLAFRGEAPHQEH